VGREVVEAKMLIVIDSLSSFVDQSGVDPGEDVHRMGPLKRITMWAMNVRRATRGNVGFLLLSEVNAQGMTKGRIGDHKADMSVSLVSDPDTPALKHIKVVKAWEGVTGEAGTFRLSHDRGSLVKVNNEGEE